MIYYLDKIDSTKHKVSILKIYNIFSKYGDELSCCENPDFIFKFISNFATYSKDKKRSSYYITIYMLILNSS